MLAASLAKDDTKALKGSRFYLARFHSIKQVTAASLPATSCKSLVPFHLKDLRNSGKKSKKDSKNSLDDVSCFLTLTPVTFLVLQVNSNMNERKICSFLEPLGLKGPCGFLPAWGVLLFLYKKRTEKNTNIMRTQNKSRKQMCDPTDATSYRLSLPLPPF